MYVYNIYCQLLCSMAGMNSSSQLNSNYHYLQQLNSTSAKLEVARDYTTIMK